MTYNFNVGPYYDDFDESKNYVRVLFKPGYAVQARELTQLQTALQQQISHFGSHIFKDGSIVLNGQTSTAQINWVDVVSADASGAEGLELTGATSGAAGVVIKVTQQSATVARLYFSYTTGSVFQQAEAIANSGAAVSYTINNVTAFTGVATSFSIADSVFYVKGHFVFCEAQTIILDDAGNLFTKKVGVDVTESIVTYADDSTLLDPSQGSYNYAAPGADRYSISLTLAAYTFDPQAEGGETTDFIEMSRFVDGVLVSGVFHTRYSDLDDTLARRTYDESGDYTVKAFGLKVVPHIFADSDKLSLAIEPGKAYVKGYEFETIATQYVDLDKARDTSTKNEYSVQIDYGSYFLINTPAGTATIDYNANTQINIKNTGGDVIGTANVKGIEYHAAATYRLYLFNVVFTGSYVASQATVVTDGSWTADIKTAATEYADGVYLIKNQRKTHLVQLPNSPIKTLKTADNGGVSETDYFAFKTFTVDFTTGVGTLATGANETLPSTTLTDYVVVFPTGGVQTVTAVGGTSSSRTVTISDTTNTTGVKVFARVSLTFQEEKVKSLVEVTTTDVAITSSVISLNKSDCYQLISIIARDTAGSPVGDLDVTHLFDFNTGQKDDLYDHGWIQLRAGEAIDAAYDVLDITFNHFTQNTATGFFSVDSYAAIDYADIPSYTASNGEVYNLRDCLDFRPRRDDGASTISGSLSGIPSQYVQADYDYYLPRIDKLVLTKEREFSVVEGIPADVPEVPNDLPNAMTLYIINVPAYTDEADDVSFSYIDNRRYTMRDIGKIEKRVERMEYYTALSLLEKQAKDEAIYDDLGVERFKNGILVDSFAGHSVGDVSNSEYSCSIEPETRTMRPRFAPFSFNYVVSALSNVTQKGDLLTLPYTTEVFLEQPFATTSVNVNPYMVFNWNGVVTLDPPTDTWVDTGTKPDVNSNPNGIHDAYTAANTGNPSVLGVRWNDWQTVIRGLTPSTATANNSALLTQAATAASKLQIAANSISTSSSGSVTRDLGSRVVDSSVVPYIRSRLVKFAAKGMKPKTDLLALFDGVDVTRYCSPAIEVKFAAGTVVRAATKVRTTSTTKEATVVMTRNDRAFVIMDAGDSPFEAADVVEWYTGSWGSSSTVTSVVHYTDLETNENGEVAGTFIIPASSALRFRTGEKLFRLADSGGSDFTTSAETKYTALGMVEPSRDTVPSRPPATNPPPAAPTPGGTCTEEGKTKGKVGRHEYTIELGAGTGNTGITYNAMSVPDRYTLIWNGQEYTTGFVGSSSYNSKLNAKGYPNVTGAGSGQLLFNKTAAVPTTATLIIDAPFSGTSWNYRVVCPGGATTAPSTTPGKRASVKVAINTIAVVYSRPLAGGGMTAAAVSIPCRGKVSWVANASVKSSARYTLTSLTSSDPNITITTNAVGQTFAENQEASFHLSIAAGTSSPTGIFPTTITATYTYASGDADLTASYNTITGDDYIRITATSVISEAYDPVAQSFFVDSATYPNGVFISGVDLFFKRKSSTAPVTVQLRPTVNGYPSAKDIIPFGVATKEAAEITTSTTGATATSFTFDNIVHLSPGHYAFVVVSDSIDYELFTARIGDYSLADPDQRVTTQVTLGSLFKSQNASTWTATQEEDIKFRLKKCVFDDTVTGEATLNTNIDTSFGDVPYDVFYTMGDVIDFAGTNIAYSYKATGDSAFTSYQLGSNVTLGARKTLACATPSSLQFKTTLTTTDSNISPVVDLGRLSNVLVQNIINNDSTDETLASGGSAVARYITRKVKLNPGFEATDLKVFFLANAPTSTSFKVYYKVATSADAIFDDNTYTEMTLESAGTFSETGFVEYKYKTPNVLGDSTVAIATGDRFDTFAIKIVMLSSDTTKVPQFRDFRVIALDD